MMFRVNQVNVSCPPAKQPVSGQADQLIFQMERAFYETMVNGHLKSRTPKILLVVEAIKKSKAYLLGSIKTETSEINEQMKGLLALLHLMEIYWKLYSNQLGTKDIEYHKLKIFLVHAYRSEYVDYFLDVLFGLIVKVNFSYYFETAKVLRMMYMGRLIKLEKEKRPSKRIPDLKLLIHKSKIKWFALELKNFECLWRQNEYSELVEDFVHKDAGWKMQSVLEKLEIGGDCYFEVLRDQDSAQKHYDYSLELFQLILDYCKSTEKSPFLNPNDKRFNIDFKQYQDLVALKGFMMNATSHEVLSLFEDDMNFKCYLLLKTIKMLMDIKQQALPDKSEELFFVKYNERLVKVIFSLVETTSLMLLSSSMEDMMEIRMALNESMQQLTLHAKNLEKILESKGYADSYLNIRREFYKLMMTFHTIYDYNFKKITSFGHKLKIATDKFMNSHLISNAMLN